MVHFCIFGGHEGIFDPSGTSYVTIFGACVLKRPTIAKQIIESHRRGATGAPQRKPFFVTIFGGTELKAPTLAEEYLDMQDALRSNLMTLEEWDATAARLLAGDEAQYGSLTLFGAFEAHELPAESDEIEGLALNRHLGNIPENAGRALELGVGQDGSQRTAVVRRALSLALPATV